MTHVPPMRLSSATIVFAPWLAAIRAARTPPDPAPMTKKSRSKAMTRALWTALEVDALLLHLPARLRHNVGGELVAPGSDHVLKVLEEYWLDREIFPARRAREESGDVLKLLFGHGEREQRLDFLVSQLRRLVELGLDRDQGLPKAVSDLRARRREVFLELGHHRRHSLGDGLLDAHGDQKLVRCRNRGLRRR